MMSVFLASMAAFLVQPHDAAACSCAMPPPLEEAAERATAVFAGTVTNIKGPAPSLVRSSADPVHVSFEVERSWKGIDTDKAVVSTAESSASCGYSGFEVGKKFIVFAYGDAGSLETGLCTRTAPLTDINEITAALGEGTVFAEDPPAATAEPPKTEGTAGASRVKAADDSSAAQPQAAGFAGLPPVVLGALIASFALVAILAGGVLFNKRRR